METAATNWNEVVKKKAKGEDGVDLGEIQGVGPNYVVTKKGMLSKHSYYIPKYLVRGFDGETLWFKVTETQAETEFKREGAPQEHEYDKYRNSDTHPDIDTIVPTYRLR
jgi:hypothetical protein